MNRSFGDEYGLVFGDWKVINSLGGKDMATICDMLFSENMED